MTRRLLAIFAPSMLAAQQTQSITCRGMDCEVKPRIPRPKNGECPVCGTMHEEFRVPVPVGPSACLQHVDDPDRRRRCEELERWEEVRMVACLHCNNIFRQWAEGREPKQ